MPRLLSCPRGHRWEEAEDPTTAGGSAPCPVCGAEVSRGTPDDEEAATAVQGASWKPLPHPLFGDHAPPSIPGYEVLGELGRGGMGIVYRARQSNTGRVVALKVIRAERLQDEDAVRRFRREAQAAARLHHPNLVHVIDSDHTGDTHYLVMELVDGQTLQRLVEDHGPLPVARACAFVRQAALALRHAQEQGLVHRDIKPSNLMVTADDSVKVLDMGVARVLQPVGQPLAESLTTLTQGGSVIGTADYIAPEQLEDPHGADIRADLYSLGCTFYFLLTGKAPFAGGSLISKLDKQRWQVPRPVDQLRPDVPAGVAAVVQKLLAKKPVDRYRSPAELTRVLDALVASDYLGPASPTLALPVLRRLAGHEAGVMSARFSPDGRWVASAGRDRNLLLWEAATGELARTFPRHSQEIRCVAFSPDGRHLATASGLTLRLWDVESGQEVRRLGGHTGAVRVVAFSPDGSRLLSGGDDKSVRVWDLQGGHEVQRYTRHAGGVTGVVELPGERVLSGGRDQALRLWDLRTGQDVWGVAARGPVLDVSASADGRLVASAHFDTAIRVWVDSGALLVTCDGHRQMVCSVAFTPDGRRLVSGGQDRTVRLWDIETAGELASANGHTGGVNCVAVSPDGTRALSAGTDRAVCLYELPPS